MSTRPDVARRHAERREQSRRKIIESAREILDHGPLTDLVIQDVARRAGLTRTAFYRHFADQGELLLAILSDLADELDRPADTWEAGGRGDPRDRLRQSLESLVAVFVEHGRVLQALADASAHDRRLAAAFSALGERFSSSAAERIHDDVTGGLSEVRRPADVAAALVWMNERYLLDLFGREPLGDPVAALETLAEVWGRTVYGRDQGPDRTLTQS